MSKIRVHSSWVVRIQVFVTLLSVAQLVGADAHALRKTRDAKAEGPQYSLEGVKEALAQGDRAEAERLISEIPAQEGSPELNCFRLGMGLAQSSGSSGEGAKAEPLVLDSNACTEAKILTHFANGEFRDVIIETEGLTPKASRWLRLARARSLREVGEYGRSLGQFDYIARSNRDRRAVVALVEGAMLLSGPLKAEPGADKGAAERLDRAKKIDPEYLAKLTSKETGVVESGRKIAAEPTVIPTPTAAPTPTPNAAPKASAAAAMAPAPTPTPPSPKAQSESSEDQSPGNFRIEAGYAAAYNSYRLDGTGINFNLGTTTASRASAGIWWGGIGDNLSLYARYDRDSVTPPAVTGYVPNQPEMLRQRGQLLLFGSKSFLDLQGGLGLSYESRDGDSQVPRNIYLSYEMLSLMGELRREWNFSRDSALLLRVAGGLAVSFREYRGRTGSFRDGFTGAVGLTWENWFWNHWGISLGLESEVRMLRFDSSGNRGVTDAQDTELMILLPLRLNWRS